MNEATDYIAIELSHIKEYFDFHKSNFFEVILLPIITCEVKVMLYKIDQRVCISITNNVKTCKRCMPRAFQICMTHGGRDDLHHSFWPPKSRQMSTKNFSEWVRHKKLTLLNEASVRFETNSTSCQ